MRTEEDRSKVYELFKNHEWSLTWYFHLRQPGVSVVSYGLGAHLEPSTSPVTLGGRCVLEALEPANSLCATQATRKVLGQSSK